tara:strand:- start:3683 stop:4882 length:1200 start_codon:yes stop_codon:yes gene_type:complete
MTRARILRLSLLAFAVLALGWLALRPAAIPVDTVVVDKGPVADVIEAEGRTRLVDRYLITAPIAGQARRQQLEVGDPVEVDQVLVVLDPLPAPALDARARAEARSRAEAANSRLRGAGEDLGAARAAAEQAASELARLEALAAQSLVALDVVDKARTASRRADREAASARFREATARHELEGARAALALGSGTASDAPAMELAAPVAGVVLRRFYESSRPVQAGEPLLEIGDPAGMEVEVDVLSADAVRLRDGMAVELHRWGDTEPLLGRVRRVEPAGFTKVSALGVEEQRVWVIVEITSNRERWQRLGDAYRVNAHFALESRSNVLRVPGSALFRGEDGGWAVFRVRGGKVSQAPVERGLQGGAWVEVLSGLAEGDIVVVHPDRALADGSRVRMRQGS